MATDNYGKIISATSSVPGTYNDKTVVKYDSFVMGIHRDGCYASVKYNLFDQAGNAVPWEGLYLICDGGYHKWRCLQAPIPGEPTLPKLVRYNQRLLSLRKDVECCFGRLKGRFRILKTPMQFRDASRRKIDNVFFTCCILHNLMMEWKKTGVLDPSAETGLEFDEAAARDNGMAYVGSFNLDEEAGFEEVGTRTSHFTERERRFDIVMQEASDFSAHGMHWNFQNGVTPASLVESQAGYRELQAALIEHFWYVDMRGLVPWDRTPMAP